MSSPPAVPPVNSDLPSILLVDDDRGILETLVDIFEDMGFSTAAASTGAQALARLHERFYNLALLDIRLPDMQGTELLAQARRIHPSMKCIMATGNASLPSAVESLNEGAYAYLQKPIEVPHVKATVRRALEAQHLEHENVRLLSQFKALSEITDAALATLELDELLGRVLDRLVFYHQAEGGAVYLYDQTGDILLPRMTQGREGSHPQEPIEPVEGITGRAARSPEVLVGAEPELNGDPTVPDRARAVLAAPLRSRNRVIGVVRLDWFTPRTFDTETIHLLEVFAARAGVLIDNARLYDAERHIARTLAESFLSRPPERQDFQVAHRYVPASEVAQIGGDYYDFIEIDEHRLGVVIGDVCGKGLTAAVYTAKAKDMLYAYARENPSPAWVLTRLNHALYSQMSEECTFITMTYGVLDSETGGFTYANAAHPPPLLYRPSTGEVQELMPTGGMVGALEGMEFSEQTVRFEPGAVLAMFTDGVTEARTEQDMLESEGVQAVLREHAGESADRIADAIFARALEFAAGVLRDDVAIVVVKYD